MVFLSALTKEPSGCIEKSAPVEKTKKLHLKCCFRFPAVPFKAEVETKTLGF
jgi:hypothetical protein